MKHLGDITKISGYEAPTVDVIVGGSPCQDLSIAGKRAGLDGERSGLFMEQIRIIKEMREKDVQCGRTDDNIRPRYMVWENVPGAFSSNKGEDFRVVLEETAKVVDKDASIPMPNSGKWTTSGCILGNGWSIAWRVLDAQFWGVPQRRRRIALVADFGGQSAQEILFIRKSLSGDTEQSQPQRKATASDATRGIGVCDCGRGKADNDARCSGDSRLLQGTWEDRCGVKRLAPVENNSAAYTLKIRGGCEGGGKGALVQTEKSATLSTLQDQTLFQPVVYDARGNGDGNTVCTLTGDHCNRVTDYTPVITVDQGGGKSACNVKEVQAPTLTCTHGGEPAVCYQDTVGSLCARDFKGVGSQYVEENKLVVQEDTGDVCYGVDAKYIDTSYADDVVRTDDVVAPLQARDYKGGKLVSTRYTVRRLTPLECERLQGYPDGWTDIGEYVDTNGKKKQSSDASRYKALGNSIAIPPWKWVMKRLCACYERDATLASLFDGIGGFPLIWEQLNGKGSCLWASEIEEFPIAVTKMRIGG